MSVNVCAAFTDPVSRMEQQPSFRQLLHMCISCRDAWCELCEQWYGPAAWILHHKHTSEAVMVKDVQWKFRAGLSVALCVRWVSLFPTYKSQSHETVLWLTQRLHHRKLLNSWSRVFGELTDDVTGELCSTPRVTSLNLSVFRSLASLFFYF